MILQRTQRHTPRRGAYPASPRSLPGPPDRALSVPTCAANKREEAAPGTALRLGLDSPRPAGKPGTLLLLLPPFPPLLAGVWRRKEERKRLEEERQREEIEKNIRLTLFNAFNDLVTGSTVWAGRELTKERIKILKDPRFEQERMQWPALQKFDRKTILKAIDGLQSILEVYS